MLIYWNVMFIIEPIVFIQMKQKFVATKTVIGIATLCIYTLVPSILVLEKSDVIVLGTY